MSLEHFVKLLVTQTKPTFSSSTVYWLLLSCRGNPWTPSLGICVSFIQVGQLNTPCVSLFLTHPSKHSTQKKWRQGRSRGFRRFSRQIPHFRDFGSHFSGTMLAIVAINCRLISRVGCGIYDCIHVVTMQPGKKSTLSIHVVATQLGQIYLKKFKLMVQIVHA